MGVRLSFLHLAHDVVAENRQSRQKWSLFWRTFEIGNPSSTPSGSRFCSPFSICASSSMTR